MKNQKVSTLILIFLLILLTTPILAFVYNHKISPQDDINKISVSVELQRKRDGRLIQTVLEEKDLICNNFAAFLNELLMPFPWDEGTTYLTLAGMDDYLYSLVFWNTTTRYTVADDTTDYNGAGGVIWIGYDEFMGPASVEDHFSLTLDYSMKTNTSVYSNGIVTITSQPTEEFIDPYDCNEAAFSFKWASLVDGNYYNHEYFMMFHDFFATISLEIGDTLTVIYRINLVSTGFTNNFGTYLAAWCKYAEPLYNVGTYPSYIDILPPGGNNYLMIYKNPDANIGFPQYQADWRGCSANESVGSYIAYGTGTTPPARSQYKLVNSIGTSRLIGTEWDYDGIAWVDCYSFSSFAAQYSITEVALYQTLVFFPSWSFIYTFMLWRATFAAITVPAGVPLRVEFLVNCGED